MEPRGLNNPFQTNPRGLFLGYLKKSGNNLYPSKAIPLIVLPDVFLKKLFRGRQKRTFFSANDDFRGLIIIFFNR